MTCNSCFPQSLKRQRIFPHLLVAVLLLVSTGHRALTVRAAGSWTVKPPPGTAVDLSSPLATGLVAAWHFDQSAVPLNLVNASLSGVFRGTPALVPTEDGIGMVATTDADFLEVIDPSNVLNFSTGPFSIAVDFYYATADPGAVLIGRDRFMVDGYSVQTANDQVGRTVVAGINHVPDYDTIATSAVLTLGGFNRVLITYNGSAATVYVNGVNQGTRPYRPPLPGARSLSIGRDATFSGLNFNNAITRVAMWKRALTTGEALQVTKTDPYAYMMSPSGVQPSVSSVSASGITTTSALVSWTTNVPADSQVQYGPTTAYGSLTPIDGTLLTGHAVALAGLSANTFYHFQVISRDASGAIVASPDSTFVTAPDSTLPTVLSVAPVSGLINVARNSAVTATFSEAMAPATINGSTMLLVPAGGTPVQATVTYNPATLVATLKPTSSLAYLTSYTATLKSGTSGVKDLSGNSLVSDYAWTFTTVPFVKPESWKVKPPAGTAIDFSNSLAANLVGAWHFDRSASPVNLANPGLSGVYRGAPTLVPTQDGIGMLSRGDADYLEVIDPSHVLDFTTGPFTIAVDFYYGTGDWGAVLVGRDQFNVDGYNIQMANDQAGRTILSEINHRPDFDGVVSGPVISLGAMHRALVTFSGFTATMYVDGVVQSSTSYRPPAVSARNLTFGRDATFSGLSFNNPITRVAMWRRALTASEAVTVTKTDPYAYMEPPSSTQPAILSVSTGSLAASAIINWATNVPADSQVQYGPTIAYGSLTPIDATLTTAHTVTIPSLAVNTLYHYQVVSRDATGAIVVSPDSTFITVADVTPPTVVQVTPGNGASIEATDVATATFSEAMSSASITGATMFLTGPGGTTVAGTVNYDAAARRATLTPSAALASGARYVATLKGGAGGVTDLTGNPLASDFLWIFTTTSGAASSGQQDRWKVKPPAGTSVDFTSPLSLSLAAAWHFDRSPAPVNLVNPLLSGVFRGSPALVPTTDGMGMIARSDADYLEVADPTNALNFTSGPFSIAVDFYYGAEDWGAVLVGRDYWQVDGFNIQTTNDRVGKTLATLINRSHGSDAVATSPALAAGTLHRLLITYSGSMATIYLDGVERGSGAYTPPVLAARNLFIGRDATFTGMNFNNPITRVVMWRRALGANEALQVTSTDPYGYMTPPSATQPTVSTVSAASITTNSALITWTTNLPADSQVEYGPAISYGLLTPIDPTATTAHALVLQNLAPNTLYHYQVVSRDATGAMVVSADGTFTTLRP
jgi:hypothetical protein